MTCTCSQPDQSGFSTGLLLGLLVGAAGGYLLSTDKGKELLADLTKDAGGKLEALKDNPAVQDLVTKIQNLSSDKDTLLATAREKINDTATRVAEATAPVKPPAPRHRFFFSGGNPLKG